jgi:hypothetical protein
MTDTLAQGERIEISWGVAIFAKDFWVSEGIQNFV